MHTLTSKGLWLFLSIVFLCVTATFVSAWTGPTQTAPNGNVSAPINIGSTDQVKSASLGLNGLAVFGNSILQASSYLNWGAVSGTSGYGIRDNAGTLEFKNSAGTWSSIQSTVNTLTGGASVWTTNGNHIYNANSGNVGIGVSGPSSKLSVVSGTSLDGAYLSDGTRWMKLMPGTVGSGSYNGIVQTNDNAVVFSGGAAGTGGFAIAPWAAATSGLRMDANGNVGIGIAAPGAKLEVVGNIRTTGSNVFAQSDNSTLNYGAAPLQVREAMYGGTGGYLAPRISFHWGGVVASQIAIESDGTMAIRDNPGTGYEKFKASSVTTTGNVNVTGALVTTNGSPTVYFADTDHRSAMIHNNSNLLYVLRGCGNQSLSWCTVNGVWPLYINLENNDAVFGGNVYAPGFLYSSDRRMKTNITHLGKGLNELLKMEPVSFSWTKGPREGTRDMGFIAQDMEKIVPDIVSIDDKGMKAIDYVRLVPILVNAMQEQQREIEKLQAQVTRLSEAK